jgi:hypothetical protein
VLFRTDGSHRDARSTGPPPEPASPNNSRRHCGQCGYLEINPVTVVELGSADALCRHAGKTAGHRSIPAWGAEHRRQIRASPRARWGRRLSS